MHLPSDIKIGADPSNDYVIKGRYNLQVVN